MCIHATTMIDVATMTMNSKYGSGAWPERTCVTPAADIPIARAAGVCHQGRVRVITPSCPQVGNRYAARGTARAVRAPSTLGVSLLPSLPIESLRREESVNCGSWQATKNAGSPAVEASAKKRSVLLTLDPEPSAAPARGQPDRHIGATKRDDREPQFRGLGAPRGGRRGPSRPDRAGRR